MNIIKFIYAVMQQNLLCIVTKNSVEINERESQQGDFQFT